MYKVTGAGCSQANAGPEITLQQSSGTATPPTGSPVGFTATLDNVASPSGTPIHFSVNGTNITTQLIDASGTGQATAGYDGIYQGVDTVSSWAVVNGKLITSAPIQVHWTPGVDTTLLDLNQSQEGGPVGLPATITASLLDGAQTPPVAVAVKLSRSASAARRAWLRPTARESRAARSPRRRPGSCRSARPTPGAPNTPRRSNEYLRCLRGHRITPGRRHSGRFHTGGSCPKPSARLKTNTLGPLKLGFTRAHARRTLKRYTTRHAVDSFCIATGHVLRAGYPTTTLLHSLPKRERKQLGGKVILLLTNAAFYKLDGIKPGDEAHHKKLRRRLHTLKAFHADGATWYVVPGKQSNRSSRSSARSSRRSGSATVSCFSRTPLPSASW